MATFNVRWLESHDGSHWFSATSTVKAYSAEQAAEEVLNRLGDWHYHFSNLTVA
jgi:ribosomal protein L20A (L18A)